MATLHDIICKLVPPLWCIELMKRTGCSPPSRLQRVIDGIIDCPENRASNRYYKQFSGKQFPYVDAEIKCETKVSDSQWLLRNVFWELFFHETLSEEQAYFYFSKLSGRYLNRLSRDWWLRTNLYRDSFTDKVLRYVTLDSLAVLVILIKLAKHKGEFVLEERIARQLYRGLLIIGAHIPNINNLRLIFFSIIRATIFNKIKWFGGYKPVLDFNLYQFEVQYLNAFFPIMPSLGLTLNTEQKQKHVYDRSTLLSRKLEELPINSLNLFLIPPRTSIKTLDDWNRVYSEIEIRLDDLRDMNYSFNDTFTSKYFENRELQETARFIRKHAPYRPTVAPSQSMVDKLFP
ncbi:hypothetical protein EV681_2314 [Advenella incenata]|uniref:Uncharacterized protein n=1 Tax=Advenella incenata TaxID=267800 RepID=A0A4Q7VF11_9BURK|nr:hypothetical protein [Advenella incenata]RZT93902.1 hypothetical protein EV681_2314 [Advenella incenata]